MEEPTMPSISLLVNGAITLRQWVTYYKNLWTRNLGARLIDVEADTMLKKENPEEMVVGDDQMPVPVKQRLEHRKIKVEDAVKLIGAMDALLALSDEDLAKKYSADALKVAEDMIPKPAPVAEKKAGDICMTEDNKPGTLQSDGKGGFTCVATAAEAAKAPGPEAAV